jgi:hypothetical protein
MRMEEPTFDLLLGRVARQTSRRAALGALIGGALLPLLPGVSEATDKAKRRKKRKRRAKARCCKLRPISIRIHNKGATEVSVEYGDMHNSPCCQYLNTVTIAAGESRVMNTNAPWAYAWIDSSFWFDFQNPLFEFPVARVARGGQYMGGTCCKEQGIQVAKHDLWPNAPRNAFAVTMYGRQFVVVRQGDSNYKRIDIWINS